MPVESWIQHSRLKEFLYDWQTVIAGVLALLAAFGTVVATMIIARRQTIIARNLLIVWITTIPPLAQTRGSRQAL
jgi:hypothetical protein